MAYIRPKRWHWFPSFSAHVLLFGKYGFSVQIAVCDLVSAATTSGFVIWWGSEEPRIEERWDWFDGNGVATFKWSLYKNGKKFDGFSVTGPLVRFTKG